MPKKSDKSTRATAEAKRKALRMRHKVDSGGNRRRASEFGYDSVDETKKRRRAIRTSVTSEDDQLTGWQRRKMISATRDLERNFSVAAWAIRKHLDYVADFGFQVRSADLEFNAKAEALFAWWAQAQNCDQAGRHSLARFVRLAEQARTVDGDVLLLQLKNGKLQAVEADRVDYPGSSTVPDEAGKSIVNGVQVDGNGRAVQYAVSRRTSGSLQFDRWVKADYAHLLGYYDRFDQVRGISRLAPAINSFQDLYEGMGYALAKAKVAQMFGLITYRDSADPLASFSQTDDSASDDPKYNINFGSGPFHLDLDAGDKFDIAESKTPAVEFQQFMQQMIACSVKSLDIPFSFYDESFTNYSGARQALLQYEQSVRAKRVDLIEWLDKITGWKIAQWVATGMLTLPVGMMVTDVPWEWIPVGLPWIDPQREISADVLAIKAGIRSRQQICKERGYDFADTAKQLGAEKILLESMGLPADPSRFTSASKSVAESITEDDEDPEPFKDTDAESGKTDDEEN